MTTTSWRRGAGWCGVLVLGALAGYVFSVVRTPIPWMLGPLLSIAAVRIAGANVVAPPGARQVGQWIIGTSLGLYFTPQVLREIGGLWAALLAGAVFALSLGYVTGVVLSRLAGLDRTTAIFASVPGGAAEMAVLGERFGARVDKVAAAQSLRIMIVVLVVPATFYALDMHGADVYHQGASLFHAGGFALLMAATLCGAAFATWLGVPNSFVLGSLAVAIPLTGAEIDLSAMPTIGSNAGQCLLGCALGSRFSPAFIHGAHRFVAAVVSSVLVSIALCFAFGWGLAKVAGLHPITAMLGNAPGGVTEMCVTAKVLQLGVPVVTAFHVTRLLVVLLATGPVFARVKRWRAATSG